MRQLSHFITLIFLIIHLTTKAQSDIQQDWWADPLLKQVHAKQPGLKIFGRKDDGERYVNMTVLNENTRQLKWFTCHGMAFDSAQLRADEYNGIIAGTLDPFAFYRNYCYESLYYIEQAEILYRVNGKAALQDTTHNNRVIFNSALVKKAQSTLQKLIAIEGLMKRICLQLRIFDSGTPRQLAIKKKDSNRVQQDFAGIMVRKADSTEYFNASPLASAARIILRKRSPDRLFVYNREGALMDSVPLKPDKYTSLLKEKEDVFLLYRGWLELQWQQVVDGKRQYAAWLRKMDSSLYKSASWEQNKQQLQNVAMSLQERQIAIDEKISSLIVPEEKYVEQLIEDFYKNVTSEISYLQGLGFAYTISYIRGQKAYELTDRRGNVMAVVSDKKKGVDGHADGIIEYYNPDIVNANDYYPFGSLMPGRAFSSENKYRYGYNGKENDNEIKGDGNQQDYGMRIYDPRLGRFLSLDPLIRNFPMLTPYQYASNTPIFAIDIDGLESMNPMAMEAGLNYIETKTGMEAMKGNKDAQQAFSTMLSTKIKLGALQFGVGSIGTFGAASPVLTNVAARATTLYTTYAVAVANLGAFTIELLNPDPNGTPGLDLTQGDEVARGLKLLFKQSAAPLVKPIERFILNTNKFDYLFGKLEYQNLKGADLEAYAKQVERSVESLVHNQERAASMSVVFETWGIRDTKAGLEKLSELLTEGLNAREVSRKVGQYGTTVTRELPLIYSAGEKKGMSAGSLSISYFYKDGNLNSTPEVTTLIPKLARD